MSAGGWLRRHLGEAAATPVLVLSLLNLLDEFDQAVYGLVGPEITRHFNISAGAFGLAFIPNVLLGMVLPVVIGYVTDRVNRVLLSLVGAAVWGGFAVLTGIVPSFLLLLLVRMMTAIGRAVSGPAHSSLISDYYPVAGRGVAFSIHQNANPIGSVIGLLAGGVLVQWWGWQAAFLVMPLPGIFALALMLRLKEPRRGAYEWADDDLAASDDVKPLPMRQSLKLLNNIQSWKRFAYVWLFLAIGVAMSSVLPFYFDAVFGVGVFGRGLILAAVALLTAVGATVGGLIAQRLLAKGDTRRTGHLLGFAMISAAVALFATAFAPNLATAVFIVLFTTPLRALAAVPVTLILSATVPPRIRGQGFGAIWFFFAIGFFFLPVALNFGDTYGFRVSVLLGAPPLVVAAIIAFGASRHIADDIRRATKVGAAEQEVRRRKAAGEKIDLLEVVDLDVAYGNVQVLFGVDMRVADGEMVALLGTNGAGKSTLLRAISGLVKPSRGVVLYDGQDITGLDAEATTARGIIHVPGGRGVFPGLSVRRNLRLGTYLYRRDKRYAAESFEHMLEVFPRLADRLDQPAGTLSGGEQQMVTLAQAFMAKPRILIIDELSLGLAPVLVEDLLQVVESINRQGVTVILVEQSVNIALTLAHRAYFMEKGEVRFEGASTELLERDDIVRSVFLAGAGRGTLVAT